MRGQIRKRGKSWSVVIYLGRDAETGGERRKWYTHPTRHDAEAHLAQLLVQIGGGGGAPPSRLLTRDFFDRWLRDGVHGRLAPTTEAIYAYAVRRYLGPRLGLLPIARLTAPAIQSCLGGMLAKGLSPATVHQVYRAANTAFRTAVRWGILVRNPCEFVDPPRPRAREMRVLDEEQTRLFLAEARRSSRYALLYTTAVLTGLRQGELLALAWGDVNVALGLVSVQRSLSRVGRTVTMKEPKTQRGRRTVALPPLLCEALRAARDDAPDDRLVFCQEDGKPLHGHNITQRDLRAVCKRAGVPRIRFHDLRHCHATHLLRQGVHPKVVQERLGHSTPAVTLGVYSHVLPGMQDEAARRVEAHLLGHVPDVHEARG